MIAFGLVGVGEREFAHRLVELGALAQIPADQAGIACFRMRARQSPTAELALPRGSICWRNCRDRTFSECRPVLTPMRRRQQTMRNAAGDEGRGMPQCRQSGAGQRFGAVNRWLRITSCSR